MKKIIKITVIIIITIITGLGWVHSASAQSLSLSVSPPILEVLIKPGKSVTQVYKITNDGSDPVILIPKLLELNELGIKEDSNPAEKWISLLNTDLSFNQPFLLPKGITKQLILRLNPPSAISEKDYYRALVFSTKPNPPADSSQSQLSQNIGSPILITVNSTGLLTKAAQVTKFKVPQFIDSFDPLSIDIDIKNTGNTYFRSVGNITLTGPIGKGSFNIFPNVILVGQTRKIFVESAENLPEPQTTLRLPGFYLGKYKVTLDFTLDQGTIKLSQSATFYALPWKAGIIILLGLIVILKLGKRKKK